MRILHTSDWHLGHTLHDASREFEHRAFLDWLVDQLQSRAVDALLVAGDIFDTSNPSAAAQELWYQFLARALKARPGLQIVAIAGNHDSADRLEAPDHLLRQFDIRVVGSLGRKADGSFDPEAALVPLTAGGEARATVIALPFLRAGDLPRTDAEDPLVAGVAGLYGEALEAARAAGLPILAMGHCYMVAGQLSELSERKVLGGNQHALPASIFPASIAYVALGHLHLPQELEGGRIRYSGSPIPLSMTERHYPHSVTVVDLDPGGAVRTEPVRIPRSVQLVRIPDQGSLELEPLLETLRGLEPRDPAAGPAPFLEVAVLMDKPNGGTLRPAVEAALEGKGYYLARIEQNLSGTGAALGETVSLRGLKDLEVEDVFTRKWQRDYKTEPTPEHLSALHELIDQVNQ